MILIVFLINWNDENGATKILVMGSTGEVFLQYNPLR